MILAFDTSTSKCSVALLINNRVDFLEAVLTDHSHSEKLFDYAEELLKKKHVQTCQLDGIIVGLGPGSYTGLRVAASAAKGLAYAQNIPVYGVSSLQLIYRRFINIHPVEHNDLVITAIDARRMEVYASAFCVNGGTLFENKAVKVEENTWSDYIDTFKNVHVAGVGVSKLQKLFKQTKVRITDHIYPSAKDSFALIKDQLVKPLDLAYFEPLYVKQFGEK